VGAAGFAGAAGLAGVAGAAAAGFEGGGVVTGVAGFSAGVFTSACTEPDELAFTPLGTAGWSAVGFGSPSGGADEGDFVSSGIKANRQSFGFEGYGENVNFYQLEGMVSTRVPAAFEAPYRPCA
jgi:hypothetical protein